MFRVRSLRLTVTAILLAKACLGSTELTVEEGTEVTLICLGNRTKTLRNIWWTSKNRVLSRCYIGNEDCINSEGAQFTAKSFHGARKYTSKLTIHNVTFHQRDQVFQCTDDNREQFNSDRSTTLRVYHVPESPICKAEVLSRGHIKVLCRTPKVFPNIVCEISQEFLNTTDMLGVSSGNFNIAKTFSNILYNSYPANDEAYNTAECSVVICPKLPGLYRFKVKIYPNVTNALVTSVDGYTNTILSLDESCEVAHVHEQNNVKKKEEANMIAESNRPTKEHGSNYQEQKFETDYMTHTSDKDIIGRQLIVILILASLLVCNFLFTLLQSLRVRCKGTKKPDKGRIYTSPEIKFSSDDSCAEPAC